MTSLPLYPDKKLRIAFYGITGCAGCQLSFIFNEEHLLELAGLVELRAFPFVKEVNPEEEFDYVFMEGLVASVDDLEVLKRLREHTKYLVSLGACACTGCIPTYRQFSMQQNYEHLLYSKQGGVQDVEPTPIDMHVRVDYYIPGCPPDKQEIIAFIKDIALGKVPKPTETPVCVECRRIGNDCLLERGKPCLGPITAGGCHAVCISGGLECWGCRGPHKDMQLEPMIQLLRNRGFDDKFIMDRMRTFAGLKLPMLEKMIHGGNNP